MQYAAVEGSLGVVEALLEVGRKGGGEEAEKLVNCGFAKVYNRHLDAYGRRTPLGSAAENGFRDMVATLLSAGAQVEAAEEDGRTPLWLACQHSHVGTAKLLLQNGADASTKDAQGVSVLEAATA